MFKRRSYEQFCVNGEYYKTPVEVIKYIKELRDKIYNVNSENINLMNEKLSLLKELDDIKPVINDPNYKPALSRDCRDCKYVARGRWNGDIIGCRKNNVCEDFVKGVNNV